MANSNTEHSKALRAKTAAAHQKQKLTSGEAKAIRMVLDANLANRFDKYCKDNDLSRPKALERLLTIANV